MLLFVRLAAVALIVAACGAAAPAAPASPTFRVSVSPTASPSIGPGDTRYTLNHDLVLRTYVLHVPSSAPPAGTPMPVVVVLWDAGSADAALAQSGWSQKADTERFLVAYAQADRGVWNDGSPAGELGRVKNGDVGYIGAILGDVQRHVATDLKRLYIAGFGSGGSLAWLAASELANRVSAVGMVGGHYYPSVFNASRGTSLLYLVGAADAQFPLGGGAVFAVGGTEQRPPLQQTIDRWLAVQQCAPGVTTADAGSVRTVVYRACRDATETVVATVTGMGHVWPGAIVPGVSARLDPVNATTLLWDFFKAHGRP